MGSVWDFALSVSGHEVMLIVLTVAEVSSRSRVWGDVSSSVRQKAKTGIMNPLQPSGHYMYRQFNIQQFYVLPTQCIYVFCVDFRKKQPLFPHTALTDWFL